MSVIERWNYQTATKKWVNIDTGEIVDPPPDPVDPPPDPVDPRANFVVGVTEPTLSNTGVLPDIVRATDTRTAISNSGTVEVFQNKTFTRGFSLTNVQNKTFINCLFEGRDGSGEVVRGTDLGNRNIKFIDCTFSQPASLFPSGYTGTANGKMGFRGHHVDFLRCQFTNVVDGFRPRYNTATGTADCAFSARGCYIGNLLFLSPDTGQDDRQSHNDCLQDDMVTGQQNVLIEGCWFWGHLNMSLTQANFPVNPSGWVIGDSRARIGGNTMYPLTNCTNVMQLRGTGGVGVKSNYRIINNWMFGGSSLINAGGISSNELKLTVTGNRIGRDMRLGQTAFVLCPTAFVFDAFSGNTYYDNGASANVRKNG